MSRKIPMGAESGTCNVCSAPCSSCMHPSIAIMGSKIDEFSDETCRETTASQFSGNDNVGSKGRPCGSLQHAAGEASNLLSANSSHDSFSVNAESKATVRSCDVSVTSEDLDTHSKLSSGFAGAECQLSPKSDCVLDQRIPCPKYNNTKGVEGHDDNMSSVSRSNDANTAVIHDGRYVDIKNLSHSSALVCSLGPEASGKIPFSLKLSSSEIASEKKADTGCVSSKVQSPSSHSCSDKLVVGGFPEVSTQISLKSEAKVEKDSGEPPDKAFKMSGHDEHHLKFNELAGLPYMQSPPQALSGNESDGSDIVEHDVKVCDICGDAGREDLLAICSKCSDGAEHTYCMKDMLQKLPEGEWRCEECKFAEETENQKQDTECKRTNKLSTQSFGKRQAENLELALAAKRLAVETSLGPAKSSNPTRTAALSRDSSFKSIDKGKTKPVSFGNVSSNDVSATACSPTGLLLQTPKGTLLKSNSFSTFNSKPKVKVVAEIVPQKQKGSKEQAPFDMKEGFSRAMSRSQSFKPTNFGRISTSESKFQALSPRLSQDLKGLKQVKECNVFDRKNLSKLEKSHAGSATASAAVSTPKVDQKLTSRGESVPLSSAGNNCESKFVKSEGKVSMLSKSNSNLARRGAELPASLGVSTMNGMSGSSAEQKPNLVIPKDEPASSYTWTADSPLNNVNENLQDGLPRSLESTTLGEKPNVSLPRPTLTTDSKSVACQKCKDMGHDWKSCPQVSSIDVHAGKNSREEMIKGNKLKAAIEAAMHKQPVSYGRNRVIDQSDGLCMASVDLDCEIASQEQLSVSNKMKNMVSLEEIHEVKINIQNCCSDFYKQSTINHAKQFGANTSDLRAGDPSSTAPLGKTPMRDLSGHAFAALSILLKMSAIPEHECIWQGGFEVSRGGKIPDLCGGIQAHLSSYASPKVLEMVNKFPQKIQLNEEPRLSTWPVKFHKSGAKEDNIALYFFAKDPESYERNYKCLVDSMMKNDLALKGNLDGVELLIFPSSQLPENCQRWNLLFFLWGIFRARKVKCSNTSKNSSNIIGLNMVPLERDIPSDVRCLSQNLCLPEPVDKDSSASDSSHNFTPAFSGPYKTGGAINRDCNNKVSCDEQISLSSQAHSQQQDGLDPRFMSGTAITTKLSREMSCATLPVEELPVCRQGTELKQSLEEIRTFISSNKVEKTERQVCVPFVGEECSKLKFLPVGDEVTVVSEKMPDLMIGCRNQVDLERCLKDDDGFIDPETPLGRNLNFQGLNCQQSSHHKRSNLDVTETVSENSCTSQKMTWKEAFVDGESSSKKPKTCFSGTYGCSISDRDSFSDGFSSQRDDLHPSSSVEDKRCDVLCDEKVIPEDFGTTERYFFPVDSHVHDFRLGSNHMPSKALSSKDEDQFRDGFPNLELALGAEKKPPTKGMLPFFAGSLDKNNNQDKPWDKVTDTGKEDVSASLSLSLSFPFLDKEQQSVKAVVKTEQLLSERRHVDTSLLLFGGLLDK